MMVIENKYEIGQTVYLITDEDQLPRIIMAIIIENCGVMYEMINTTTTSRHYDFEISDEKHLQLT